MAAADRVHSPPSFSTCCQIDNHFSLVPPPVFNRPVPSLIVLVAIMVMGDANLTSYGAGKVHLLFLSTGRKIDLIKGKWLPYT